MTASQIDYEAEYNNPARVPEYADIAQRFEQASEATRSQLAASAQLDVAYGAAPRQRYDLFQAAGENTAPLVVYIHGGVWQRGDRKDYSFVARELVANGIDVAIPSYTLCPEVTVAHIFGELRSFMRALYAKTRRHPVVVGHSVGGTMAAAMLATDWSKEADVPADLVRRAYAISGVFEVEPYVHTSYNRALGLTVEAARVVSPALWPAPATDSEIVAAVGGAESAEFIRQSRDLAAKWAAAGLTATFELIPEANHFTVLDPLARPESPMLRRIIALARSAPAAD